MSINSQLVEIINTFALFFVTKRKDWGLGIGEGEECISPRVSPIVRAGFVERLSAVVLGYLHAPAPTLLPNLPLSLISLISLISLNYAS
ncbi:MAG: hypothetical protein U7123_10915 [Potamolinea sp.]